MASKREYGDPDLTPQEMLVRLVWRAKHRLMEYEALGDEALPSEEARAWGNYKDTLDAVFEHVEANLAEYDPEETT
jgi:hypothetical protein